MADRDSVSGGPTGAKPARENPFYPDHVLREIMVIYVALGVLVSLAVWSPFDLMNRADPLATTQVVKPQWFFLFIHQPMSMLPAWPVVWALMGLGLLFLLWPFVANALDGKDWKKKTSLGLALALLLVLAGFTCLGLAAESSFTLGATRVEFDVRGLPHLGPAAAGAPLGVPSSPGAGSSVKVNPATGAPTPAASGEQK